MHQSVLFAVEYQLTPFESVSWQVHAVCPGKKEGDKCRTGAFMSAEDTLPSILRTAECGYPVKWLVLD